jgi:hypothetical protein
MVVGQVMTNPLVAHDVIGSAMVGHEASEADVSGSEVAAGGSEETGLAASQIVTGDAADIELTASAMVAHGASEVTSEVVTSGSQSDRSAQISAGATLAELAATSTDLFILTPKPDELASASADVHVPHVEGSDLDVVEAPGGVDVSDGEAAYTIASDEDAAESVPTAYVPSAARRRARSQPSNKAMIGLLGGVVGGGVVGLGIGYILLLWLTYLLGADPRQHNVGGLQDKLPSFLLPPSPSRKRAEAPAPVDVNHWAIDFPPFEPLRHKWQVPS